jgi:hypothetical protein
LGPVQKSVLFVVFFRIHMLPTFLNETYIHTRSSHIDTYRF